MVAAGTLRREVSKSSPKLRRVTVTWSPKGRRWGCLKGEIGEESIIHRTERPDIERLRACIRGRKAY